MEQQKPADAFIKFALAQEYANLNDFNNALLYYTSLVENFSAYLPSYYHLGKLYEQLNQPALAIGIYSKGLELAKKTGDAKTAGEINEALMLLEDE